MRAKLAIVIFERLALAAAIAFGCLGQSPRVQAADIANDRAGLETKYAAQLADLAAWCDQHQLTAEAKQVRGWLIPRDPRKIYIFVLPDALTAPAGREGNAAVAEWWTRWFKLRRAEADALFALAGKAIDDHQPALAYELIRETVREFPDHQRARIILGYEKYGGHWVSAYAAHRLALSRCSTIASAGCRRPKSRVPARRSQFSRHLAKHRRRRAAAFHDQERLADRNRALRRDHRSQPGGGRPLGQEAGAAR